MREHCLRIAELNLKLNTFADSTIFTICPKRQKVLEAERYKLYILLKMLYPKVNPDNLLAPVNTKGIKFSTDVDVIEQTMKEELKERKKSINCKEGVIWI